MRRWNFCKMKTEKTSYLKCSLCVSVLLLVCGLVLLLVWPVILKHIFQSKLVLSPDSELFSPWRKTPFSVPLDFYLFNWTNPEDIYNNSIKPRLQQVGPYRFLEDYEKSDVTWNENGTVTFRHLKFWHYNNTKENGDLQKNVTIINPILLAAGSALRSWNYFVRAGFSFTLSTLKSNISMTSTVDNILFKGVKEPIIDAANTMSFLTGKIPYDKFGFFYKRNGSSNIDGVFNMGTGINSTFGKLYSWNYMTQTPYFQEECSKIEGSAGDFFEPNEDNITFYVPYLCRPLVLKNVGRKKVNGIEGYQYVLEDLTLDNGTKYARNKCYCNNGCIPSGLINISVCNYDSPMFISLPHFYRADPYYVNMVEGLEPNEEEHEFSITLEPNTGFTLEADAKMQVNVLLEPISGISLLSKVPKVYFPLMWTRHKFQIPDEGAAQLKLLSTIHVVLFTCGIVMSIISLILLCYIIYKKFTVKLLPPNKEDSLYKEQTVPFEINR